MDARRQFDVLVDHVMPLLPPYDFALYVLLLRLAGDEPDVRVGKRTIARLLGKGTRASSGNYQHISDKLEALEGAGFIQAGDTTRTGTRYLVRRPDDIASVRERLAALTAVEPLDHFNDPVLRRALYERDRYRCRYCGGQVDDEATLDHIVPRSLGGSNDPDNLATCCLVCNSLKSGRTYDEAAPEILRRMVAGRL